MLRIVFFVLLIIFQTGCFVAPGMKMREIPNLVQARAAACEIKPNFIPITVALVRQLNECARDNDDDAYYYHVGAHDILNIHVWGHPELASPMGQTPSEQGRNAGPSIASTGYLVSPDGNIFFPMLGVVRVAGNTVDQNRAKLIHLLKRYIRNPQLDVRVIGFRSKKIYVMGEVKKPGLQPLTDAPMSITDAINLAEGFDVNSADPSHIFVIRGDYARPDVYWLNAQYPDALILGENFRLRAHDVVYVSTAAAARWNRAIEQILPTIQTIWFTVSLANQVKS